MGDRIVVLCLSVIFSVCILFSDTNAYAQELAISDDYSEFDLSYLMNATVTSSSGRDQNMMTVSNAMTVITKEDIERSGARELAELFYKVPGMQVRRYNAHEYGVGVRSAGTLLQSKLLVLIDGVIVFNPAFSGTRWADIPVSLEEIERIEIIRGPGGVLYSSNAVLGVINIITKGVDSDDTYIRQVVGTQGYSRSSVGISVPDMKSTLIKSRVYYAFDTDDGLEHKAKGGHINDNIERHNAGAVIEIDTGDTSNLVSHIKYAHSENMSRGLFGVANTYKQIDDRFVFSTKYDNHLADNYDYDLQFFYAFNDLSGLAVKDNDINMFDLKTQHNFYYNKHVISLGAEILRNYWEPSDQLLGTAANNSPRQTLWSLFAQDEYNVNERLIATVGLRADKNSNVIEHDWQLQPRLALTYLFNENHSLRTAFSRTHRQPSMGEREMEAPMSSMVTYEGSYDLKEEKFTTAELGYSGLLLDEKMQLNLDAYYTHIDDMVISHNNFVNIPTTLLVTNNGDMNTYGFEMFVSYKLTDKVLLYSDYSYIGNDARSKFTSSNVETKVNQTSKHMLGFGTRLSYGKLNVDLYAKWIDGHKEEAYPYAEYLYGANILKSDPNVKVDSFFKSNIRISYDFLFADNDAQIELIINDVFDKHQVETVRDVYTDPQVSLGMKLRF